MNSIRLFAAAVALSPIVSLAKAQDPISHDSSGLAGRAAVGVAVVQSRPQGDLASNIGIGYGVNGTLLYRLDQAGIMSLRADVGVVAYGTEVKTVAFSETVGDRVRVGVRTTNFAVPMSVGPQVTWPSGVVRPYVNAGVGGQAFFTESNVEQTNVAIPIASTTNQSDFAFSWTTGAGVYIPITAGPATILLDVGMQYMNGRQAQYLAKGSIVDQPNGA
ncbi:MAG: hypothetical protein ABIY52_03130, partial [Gemmatimonadaceae bacterium]